MPRTRLAAPLVALACIAGGGAAVASAAPAKAPVIEIMQEQFGHVLATPSKHALYTWNREKDLRVHCTGACAKQWPPVTVKAGVTVARHYRGIMATVGTIRRPDGTRQLTINRRPVYTYVGDGPTQVKCNGVDGWFVVKA